MSKRKYVVWRNKSDYEKVKERVINEASMIIEAVQHHGIDKLENIHVEKFFSKPLPCNQHSVAGKVDMVANNGTWLLEMKMSANPKWRDHDQLFFYGLLLGAIQRRYPRRLSFFLPVMPSVEDRLLDIEFSKDDFIALYKRIQDLIEAWNKRNFHVTDDFEACKYCTVKNHCRESNR